MRDLTLIVADKSMWFTLRAALKRHQSLGVRALNHPEFRVHMNRDGGVRTDGAKLLALERNRSRHGLLVLDYRGSGASGSAIDLERQLDAELATHWDSNAKAIVIDPELENWLWGSDQALAQQLNWQLNTPIREWLQNQGTSLDERSKPHHPKEALFTVLETCRIAISAALYERIASHISLTNCTDPAARRLLNTLRSWFPPE